MSAAPPPLNLRADDFGERPPAWAAQLFERLNAHSAAVSQALAKGITRSENLRGTDAVAKSFTSEASGVTKVDVKHNLPTTPKHSVVTALARDDGQDITAAWSATAKPKSSGVVEFTFQGLTASIKYVFSATFE